MADYNSKYTGAKFDEALDIVFGNKANIEGEHIPASQKGAKSGVASLGTDGKVPAAQLPNYAGASTQGGAAASAVKLATARTIRTNLASTGAASFDGSGNVTPGVTGTLPIANGGTGNTAGKAASATKLATARTLTIGSKGKSFDGSANVSWSLAEMGAAPAYTYGTEDLTAGTSALATGTIHLVYE